MALTVKVPTKPVRIVAPVHRMSAQADPNWRKVEAVACRFALPSHRRSVRVYLYSVLKDVEALHRFADDWLYKGKLRRAIRRGKRLLDEARAAEPGVFEALMTEFTGNLGSTG